jgi:hypothetical protein
VKRRILLAGSVVLLFGLLVFFGLPALHPRCQNWFHRVTFTADRLAEDRYGMGWGQIERRFGEGRTLEIRDDMWTAAIEKVGAKPFHCF